MPTHREQVFPGGDAGLVRVGEGREADEQLDSDQVRAGDVEGLTGPVTAPTVPIGMTPNDTAAGGSGKTGRARRR